MKEIRKGNDTVVTWSLKREGEPFILEGLSLTLYLKSMYDKKPLSDYSVSGNKIIWTFYGKDQAHTGNYSLELVVNKDEKGMMTTDACNFVRIVSCSCQTSKGSDDCGIKTEIVDIESEVEYGGSIIVVDKVLSESSENPVQNKVVTSAINDLKTSMDSLSQSVSSLSEKVDGYSDDIEAAVGKSDEATKAVAEITSQINGIIEEVGSLSDKVENLENGEISWTDVQ